MYYKNYKNIQPVYRNGIWKINICHVDKKKKEKNKYGRKRTTSSRKHQNNWCKIKRQVFGKTGRKYRQREMNEIVRKEYFISRGKLLETKLCSGNRSKGQKHLASPLSKIVVYREQTTTLMYKNIICLFSGFFFYYEMCDIVEWKRTPPPNEFPVYDTEHSNGEVPVMLELWGMWSTP